MMLLRVFSHRPPNHLTLQFYRNTLPLEMFSCPVPPGSLDLTTGVAPQILSHSISDGRAWLAEQLVPEAWRIRISDSTLAEIKTMLEVLWEHPLPLILRHPDDFEIPHLREITIQAKFILDKGCGFCILEGMPMEDEEIVSCYWVLSQLIGRTVAQKWDGTMVYNVTDTGKSFSYGVRGSHTNAELVFHTDNAFGVRVPNYVGLLCKYPAPEGGVSRFCSFYSIHNRLLEQHPKGLERLYQPMLFDRQKEHADTAPKTVWAPFFIWNGESLMARANVQLVRKGYQVANLEMDVVLSEALEVVEDVANSPDLWLEAPLERGQVQFLNNHELGHYRSHFTDHPDPRFKRHLYRTWHRDSGARTYDG